MKEALKEATESRHSPERFDQSAAAFDPCVEAFGRMALPYTL
jgi:hypothetical protein